MLDLVGKSSGMLLNTRTAYDILLQEKAFSPILTFSKEIDKLLNGGIFLSKVTEISGIAGVGKTQFWYCICLLAQQLSKFINVCSEFQPSTLCYCTNARRVLWSEWTCSLH